MQSNRTISVIIPTYNRASFITASINSVLKQKIPKNWQLEIVVVDDGSTDNTLEILKDYADKKLIKLYPINHSGKPSVARNFAIRKANGEIIAFQDSDDLWSPNKISDQINLFEEKNIVLTYGRAEIIDENNNPVKGALVSETIINNGQKFNLLLKDNVISTLTVMVKREALVEVGLFDESDQLVGIEDYELWLRISASYPNGIKYLDKTLAYYRRHANNISNTDTLTSIKRILNTFDSLWENKKLSTVQRNHLEKQIEIMHSNYSRQYAQIYGAPMVSVIMGAYNAERFIRPAVDSILSQTYKNFEFIIINDGSKDETINILKAYNDPRIHIINQSNHGLVFSLNKAIELSTGEYIARMDADDICLPSRFEKEVEWLSQSVKRGLVSTFFSLINFEDGKPLGTTLTFPIRHIDLRRSMYITNPFPHGACMYRSKAIKSMGLYSKDYVSTEDYELWVRMAKEWEVGLIPESLYWYRINNPNSISQKTSDAQEKFVKKIRDEQWNDIFVKKTITEIKDDLFNIRHEIPSGYREMTESEYKSQQYTLTKELLNRGKIKQGLNQLIGTFLIYPDGGKKLLRLLPRGIYRGFRKKIYSRRKK